MEERKKYVLIGNEQLKGLFHVKAFENLQK